jgi:hypothetical protein
MAIVQISKIIHRTGAYTDLPQLDIGEIGFATDEQRVFIGNDPDIIPPANVDATTQTEILTTQSYLDFSRITGSANSSVNIDDTTLDAGQILVANIVTGVGNVWENYTGNLLGPNADVKLNLGSEANLSITGGVNGYVLTTDGSGNLSWMPGSGGGGGGSPTGSNQQVQFNDGGSFGGNGHFTYDYVAQALTVSGIIYANTVVANSQGKFDGTIGSITPGVATFSSVTVNNNVTIAHTLTANKVLSTSNGAGENYKVGDDAWIGDINVSDTIQIKGVEDDANAYIVFGTSDTASLGRSGVGPLTYTGDFTSEGNVTANTLQLGTWTIFANVGGIFCTDSATSTTYQVNLTAI